MTTSDIAVPAPSAQLSDLMNDDKVRGAIAAVLPKHLTPERIIKVALGAAARSQKLGQCTPSSFITAVVQASELGLEPGSALGHAYLVPFWNSTAKAYECQMIPGYRGLISLARRSGQIVSIEAHPVFKRDHFRCEFGSSPVLEHRPWMADYGEEGEVVGPTDPGPMIAAYAVARLKDGGIQIEVMTRAQIMEIKGGSQQGRKDEGPWFTDLDEMARKTVVRRIFKYLPVSIELASALERLETIDSSGEMVADVNAIAPQASALETGEQRIASPLASAAEKPHEKVKERVRANAKPRAEKAADTTKAAPATEHVPPAAQETPPVTQTVDATGLVTPVSAQAPQEPSPVSAPSAVATPAIHSALEDFRSDLLHADTPAACVSLWRKHKGALRVMPRDQIHDAWNNLVTVCEDVGRRDDADAWLKAELAKPARVETSPPDDEDEERQAIQDEPVVRRSPEAAAKLLAAINALRECVTAETLVTKYVSQVRTLPPEVRSEHREFARTYLRGEFGMTHEIALGALDNATSSAGG